jgi:hypothetical protein
MEVSQRQSIADIITKLRSLNTESSSPEGGKGKLDLPLDANNEDLATNEGNGKLAEVENEDRLIPTGAVVKIIFFGKELKGNVRIKETGIKEGSVLQAFVIFKEELDAKKDEANTRKVSK